LKHISVPEHTQWKVVWDNLYDFILVNIKAKNRGDALVSPRFFNEDSGQKK